MLATGGDPPAGCIGFVNLKRLLAPIHAGVGAARHLAWYVAYHVTGEPRRI